MFIDLFLIYIISYVPGNNILSFILLKNNLRMPTVSIQLLHILILSLKTLEKKVANIQFPTTWT